MTLKTPNGGSAELGGVNRSVPHSVEAEEAVLGCVLINPDVYHEVAAFLKAEDFYLHKHRWIWDAYGSLLDQHLPIDILTVTEELDRHNQLQEIGGAAYLTRLVNAVPTSLHAEAYARLVEQEAVRRRLIEAATQIAKLAYTTDRSVDDVVADAGVAVLAVSERRKADRTLVPLSDLLGEYYDKLRAMVDDPSLRFGLLTGLLDVDAMTGGFYKGDLIIVAGRPGAGKTAFMGSVGKFIASPVDMHNQPKQPKNVAVFSLEMPREQWVMRMLAHESEIEISKLRHGEVSDEQWPVIVQAHSALGDYRLFIDDTPALRPSQLRAKCHRLALEYGLDLVIVDYLQLMAADRRRENRTQEVSAVSRALKQLAMELNIPVLAGAQLNRAVEYRAEKKPMLADLRDSGGLEQDGDLVLFLWPADNKYLVNLTVAKQRNGCTGDMVLFFRKEYGRFENAETRTAEFVSV